MQLATNAKTLSEWYVENKISSLPRGSSKCSDPKTLFAILKPLKIRQHSGPCIIIFLLQVTFQFALFNIKYFPK